MNGKGNALITWPFSNRARLEAAKGVLERVATAFESRVCAQLWDGSIVPLGPDADPNLRIIFHSPGVISSLLRWPTLDNLVNHFALGRIELQGADLTTFWEMARGQGGKKARRRLKPLSLLP